MYLRLYFVEIPSDSMFSAIDRRLETLARRQEPIEGGRRLWITHVPETQTRPFLNARPFDIFVVPMRFSNARREEFRVSLGAEPKRCMVCKAPDDTPECSEVLFVLASEIMARSASLLCLDEKLARQMFHIDDQELDFPAQCLDDFPGAVYEIAHELECGDLGIEWFVDARWLKAWISRLHPQNGLHPEVSRFSSLDYS